MYHIDTDNIGFGYFMVIIEQINNPKLFRAKARLPTIKYKNKLK